MVIETIHRLILSRWFTLNQVKRFLEFSLVGMLSFVLDIGLMWFFIYLLGTHYIIGAVIAFIIATLFNYTLNRIWSFKGTKTEAFTGYIKFFTLASVNIGVIAALLYFFVEILKIPPLMSRITAGLLLFVSNYLINLRFIFKMFASKETGKNAKNLRKIK